MKSNMSSPATLRAATLIRSTPPVSVLHLGRTPARPPSHCSQAPAAEPRSAQRSRLRPAAEAADPDIVFRLYAREIGRLRLLEPHEEADLARRIHQGDDAAREEMIKANLRLVVKIARDFDGYGLALLDLISEGNIGLMRAVERYDPAKGAKVSTYASFYIKQAMRRAIADHGRLIRLPVYAQEKLMDISRAETRLRELFGRAPTDEEISGEIRLPAVKVRRLRTAALPPTSLDAPQDEGADHTVAEMVADENAHAPDEDLRQEDTAGLVLELMQHLPPRELQIIRRRFGFEDGAEKTLEEIGREMGLTRERIRQLQNSALRKLRTRMAARESVGLAA